MNIDLDKGSNVKLIVLGVLTFIILLGGVSYAYFTINVSGNEEASSIGANSAAGLYLTYNDAEIISGDNVLTGWSQSKTISVENTGDLNVTYNLIWRELLNEFINDELVISMTCSSNVGTCEGMSFTPLSTYTTVTNNVPIKSGIEIEPGERHTYTVTVMFIETGNYQNYNKNKRIRGTINVEESVLRTLYRVIYLEATEGTYATLYTGEHKDSYAKAPTNKIYHFYTPTSNDATQGNALLDKVNVIYAGFCWQMIRTTDTGGVKLLYNGVPTNNACPTGRSQQLASISRFSGPNLRKSPAYIGYKWGTVYEYGTESPASGSVFGSDVTYNGTSYTLTKIDENYPTTPSQNYHYSCNTSSNVCSEVRFYYYVNGSTYRYITLSGGVTIEGALEKMFTENTTNSLIKQRLEEWYETYIKDKYDTIIETDTIYCNDRSIDTLGGWSKTGSLTSSMHFRSNLATMKQLDCPNETDQFSTTNTRAQLNYSIGLLTAPEFNLINNATFRATGDNYWLGSPAFVDSYGAYGRLAVLAGVLDSFHVITDAFGVRPLVTLSSNAIYTRGDGSMSNPYIVYQEIK